MIHVKHIKNTRNAINSIPISEGQILFATDTKEIMLDVSNTERINLSEFGDTASFDDKSLSNQFIRLGGGNYVTSQYTGVNIHSRRINNHFERITGKYDLFGNPVIENTYYCSLTTYEYFMSDNWIYVWAGLPNSDNLLIHSIKASISEITDSGIVTSMGRGSYYTQRVEVKVEDNFIYYRLAHNEFGLLSEYEKISITNFNAAVVITVEFSFDTKSTVLENVYGALYHPYDQYTVNYKYIIDYRDYWGAKYYTDGKYTAFWYYINTFSEDYFYTSNINTNGYIETIGEYHELETANTFPDYIYISPERLIDISNYNGGFLAGRTFSFAGNNIDGYYIPNGSIQPLIDFLMQYRTESGINKSFDIYFNRFNAINSYSQKLRYSLILNTVSDEMSSSYLCADNSFGTIVDINGNLENVQTKHTWFRLHDFVIPAT